MTFTSGGTYGKYKHQHNPGTLGADWNRFTSSGRLYVDYREVNFGNNYQETDRFYIGSNDIDSITDRIDNETNASQIGISGKTENAVNIMYSQCAYMFIRVA